MSLSRNLRPDRNITGLMVPLTALLIFVLSIILFGAPGGLTVLGILMLLFSLFYLFVFFRTGNIPQLAIVFEGIVFAVLLLLLEPHYGIYKMPEFEFRIASIATITIIGGMLVTLALTRRVQWRGREIFELAGTQVSEIGNGYTHRPRPIGKVDYSPQQIRAFSRFCARSLIALPYLSANNITLVPIKMGEEFGRLLGLSGDYREATWVNFDMTGEVSVHISQKDYLEYRERLAFDPLCVALGQLFVEILTLHAKGEGVLIINKMDDLKIGIFS